MPVVTPEFLFDFESNMQALTEREYDRLIQNLWWQKVAKVRPSSSKKEVIAWLLSTAMIKDQGKGGNVNFDELVSLTTEYVNGNSGTGLKLKRDQLEDADGKGLEYAAQWAGDIGAYMAYWPQKQVAKAILNGETGLAYDGQAFFKGWNSSAHTGRHPYNPFDTALGGYANVFTGSADSGSGYNYPGACPIDDSVTLDNAVINLSKAIAYIGSIKMPNGEDPRMLVPRVLMGPPRMTPRLQQLTKAKVIAQAAASGGGGADVEAIVHAWGFQEPVEVQEFGANFSYKMPDGSTVTGSDTTAYLLVEQLTSSQLGALTYVEREPFNITYYTGNGGGTGVDAIIDRARELEWHCQGRNITGYGHPFLLFKLKAS